MNCTFDKSIVSSCSESLVKRSMVQLVSGSVGLTKEMLKDFKVGRPGCWFRKVSMSVTLY